MKRLLITAVVLGLLITGSNAVASLITNGDFSDPGFLFSGVNPDNWTLLGDAFENVGALGGTEASPFPGADQVAPILAGFGDYMVLDDIGSGGNATRPIPNSDVAGIEQSFFLDPSPTMLHVGFDYFFGGYDTALFVSDIFRSSFTFDIRGVSFPVTVPTVVRTSRLTLPTNPFIINGLHFDADIFVPRLDAVNPNALISFKLTETALLQGGGAGFDATDTWVVLDNVVVEKVPEPGTMLLLGSGLAGLALFRRRRRACKV